MEFELTQEILDQIFFAMEDQTEVSMLDAATGEVVIVRGDREAYEGAGYLPIPDWKPVDGYQLMERFVTGLRNPLLQEELRGALAAGKGVFRSFKDSLRKVPEIERRWYLFKEREMRRVVYEWYNQVRELQGLERLSLEPLEEPENSEELIQTDFVFSVGVGTHERELEEADREAFVECYRDLERDRVELLLRERRGKYSVPQAPGSLVVVAEDQGGQLAGFAWGVRRASVHRGDEVCKIVQLCVTPAYRGIGLGSALLRRFVELAAERRLTTVLVDLGSSALRVAELFTRQGFAPVSQLLGLDIQQWRARGGEQGG